jgi:hypothetical protein
MYDQVEGATTESSRWPDLVKKSSEDGDPVSNDLKPLPTHKLLPSKREAIAQGALVVNGFRAGVRALIEACVRTAESIQRFQDDEEALRAFLRILVDGNVISESEARLGLASPKLSKLNAIGENAGLLYRDEIFQHLEPGYTIPYQVIVLYRALSGDQETRLEQLIHILRTDRPITGEALIARTNVAKRAQKHCSSKPVNVQPNYCAGQEAIGQDYELLYLTPEPADFRRIGEDYADNRPLCLRVYERVAEDAVAVVRGRLSDLSAIENKLLPACGFSGLSHVLLASDPVGPNVTDADIIIFAERGLKGRLRLDDIGWFPDGASLDALSLISRLLPDAMKKLHLFASSGSTGWSSVVGEANWSQADE